MLTRERNGAKVCPSDPITLAELLPVLHALPPADKRRAMQFLTAELADEQGAGEVLAGEYSVWSPFDAHEAVDTLTDYLREHKGKR